MTDDTPLVEELLRSNASLRADLSVREVGILTLERENAALREQIDRLRERVKYLSTQPVTVLGVCRRKNRAA